MPSQSTAITVREIQCQNPGVVGQDILQSCEPVLLRGLVAHWPLVKAAAQSNREAMEYLKKFYNGRSTIVCQLPPENKGRLFYNDSCTELNYQSYKGYVNQVLDAIAEAEGEPDASDYYIASNPIKTHFPEMLSELDLALPRASGESLEETTVSIWLSSATTASCHYDALDNIACCAAGKRRFTLFPPEQVKNLYPGPLSPTPGGQAISLVDFGDPDYAKFPGFSEALNHSLVAELTPGDALYIPSMWWHHVEGLCEFNALVNFWWSDAPLYMASGMNALYMAMLSIRDKPKHERDGWKQLFDYYIFDGPEPSSAHIPKEAQGFLGKLDELSARKLRSMLINRLNK